MYRKNVDTAKVGIEIDRNGDSNRNRDSLSQTSLVFYFYSLFLF